MISQDMISDEAFNCVSLEAQNIFIRMLAVSDDCGVVPANSYKLNVLINTPPKLSKKIQELLDELIDAGLGYRFTYNGENFFAFKPKSFEDYQSYILKKATKSEYLRIPKKDFEELSKNFPETPRVSSQPNESALSTVESRKQKVESKEQRVESKEQKAPAEKNACGEFLNVLLTDKELQQLSDRLGSPERAQRAIEILSAYKESKGAKYKSDFATIRNWVIGELEKREKGAVSNGNRPAPSVDKIKRYNDADLEAVRRRAAADKARISAGTIFETKIQNVRESSGDNGEQRGN